MLAVGLAALTLAGPPADVASVAPSFAPARARVVLARELDAELAVVAWAEGQRVGAVALAWRDGRWRRARPVPRAFVSVEPRPGATIGRRAEWIAIVTRRASRLRVWLDGRPRRGDAAARNPRGGTDFYSVLEPSRGRHVVIAIASAGARATARAWSYRVR